MSMRSILLFGAAPLVALVASCNLIVPADTMSCETDADCVNFPNFGCDTAEGVCVSLDQCSANAECAEDEVCRPVSPRRCEKIRQGNCQEIYPDNDTYRDDNAILVGVTAPLTEEQSTGYSIVNGAKVAVDHFNQSGGIARSRPIVLVICDDGSEAQKAYDNGITLSNIGTPAIIGPAFSGQTLRIAGTSAEPGTVANNIALISPSATSPLVTGIQDKSPKCASADDCPGLVWRTSPADTFQGAALGNYFPIELEPVVRQRGGATRTGPIKVAVLFKPDSYGQLISEVVKTTLRFNGESAVSTQNKDFFYLAQYDDIDEATDGVQPDPAVIQEALAEQPDAIYLLGTGEVAEIMRTFEADWPGADADRPYYILGDGGLSGDVIEAVRDGSTEQPKIPDPAAPARPVIERLRGTVPGPVSSPIFDAFRAEYDSNFPPDETKHGANIFGAAGAFDIVYMIAYSVIAAGETPITGDVIARGFARLADTDSTIVNAGTIAIGTAEQTLSNSNGTINFEGASGSLDFDIDTGEAPSPIQVWCVPTISEDSSLFTRAYYDGQSITGLPEPEHVGADYTCPFHYCNGAADCDTHPWGAACIEDVCGCNNSADCVDPGTCDTETKRCE
ncbi:MAG: ABC transporter substrate-binding protein [Polyangiaceae bacterium]|nr:ABC transporter substrate-binding protein [Polyangiaceae bacterium]